jgi:hypothetical protein
MGTTSNSSVSSTINMLIAVCGPRFTYVASDPLEQLTVQRQTTDSDPKLVNLYDLFSYQDVQVFPISACLTNFTLCDDVTCGDSVVQAFSGYLDMDANYLFIRQDVPLSPTPRYVAAKQPSGEWLKLPIHLEICGAEEILPINSGDLLIQPGSVLSHTFADLFVNSSPYCQITSFTLTDKSGSAGSPAQAVLDHLTVGSDGLDISADSPIMSFAVLAESVTGIKSWLTFHVEIDICVNQTVSASPDSTHLNVTKNIGITPVVL